MGPEMHFEWTINLGNLITAIVFVLGLWGTSMKLTARATTFENRLSEHTLAITHHSDRMGKQDDLLLTIIRDVERLIGRLDAQTERRRERRDGPDGV